MSDGTRLGRELEELARVDPAVRRASDELDRFLDRAQDPNYLKPAGEWAFDEA